MGDAISAAVIFVSELTIPNGVTVTFVKPFDGVVTDWPSLWLSPKPQQVSNIFAKPMSSYDLSSSLEFPPLPKSGRPGLELDESSIQYGSSSSDGETVLPTLRTLRLAIRRLRKIHADPNSTQADRQHALNVYEAAYDEHVSAACDPASEEYDLRGSTVIPDHASPVSPPRTGGKVLPVVVLGRTNARPVVVISSSSSEELVDDPPRPVRRKRLVRQDAVVEPERDLSPVRNPHGSAPPKPTSMAKDWCYTLNSPSRDDLARLRGCCESNAPKVVYHVFQIERGAAGNLHIQGFICLGSRVRMSTVKTLLGTKVHLEIRRGTPLQAADYCRDPAKRDPRHAGFLYEFGDLPDGPLGQGARSDLAAVQTLLDNHVPMATVAREHFNTWVKSYKAFDKYVTEFVSEPRKEKSLFFCFTGESGTGKSQAAYSFTNAFTVPPGSSGVTWFDGYDALRHQTVLFDEFAGSRCSWTELLRLTDKYPHAVNTKGSQQQFNPKALVFTSNSEPQDWYPNIPEKLPLLRRIDAHWQYWRRDTKVLSPNVMQAVEGLEAATELKYHAIVCCNKGDPKYHPLVHTYTELLLDKDGKQWFVIPVADLPPALPVQGLWSV